MKVNGMRQVAISSPPRRGQGWVERKAEGRKDKITVNKKQNESVKGNLCRTLNFEP